MCHCDSVASLPGAAEGLEEQELARMQAAVHQLLVGVGEDPEREGLVDTPRVRGPGGAAASGRVTPPTAAASRCRRALLVTLCLLL